MTNASFDNRDNPYEAPQSVKLSDEQASGSTFDPNASLWERFKHAPLILRAFTIYAVGMSVLGLAPLFWRALSALITPYTGWGLMNYWFIIFFAISTCINNQRKQVFSLVGILIIIILHGVYEGWLNDFGQGIPRHADNPYLMYSPYRPLVTIAMPILWILLLLSPPMLRWIFQKPAVVE